jgi:hypothetical protein
MRQIALSSAQTIRVEFCAAQDGSVSRLPARA